jgi:hypothetical protein
MVALKGAEYLEELLRADALFSEPATVLDKIYALSKKPHLTRLDVTLGKPAEEILISKEKFTEIAKEYNDEEIAALGKRAIIQITKQLDTESSKREQAERQQQEVKAAEMTDIKGENLESKENKGKER